LWGREEGGGGEILNNTIAEAIGLAVLGWLDDHRTDLQNEIVNI
jgi:hypothetical protein